MFGREAKWEKAIFAFTTTPANAIGVGSANAPLAHGAVPCSKGLAKQQK